MTSRAVATWFALLLAAHVAVASRVILRKCCPSQEKLAFTSEGLACEAGPWFNQSLGWLAGPTLRPGVARLLGAAARETVRFGARWDCAIGSQDVLRHSAAARLDDFRLHVREGEVRLEVLKEGSLHDPDHGREDSFPPSSYCVDAGPGDIHVAVLCPCAHIICVRKCCADGFVFNHTSMTCVDGDSVSDFADWVPRLSGKFDYYRLPSKRPKCKKFSSRIISTKSNNSQLLLFPNATLQVPGMEYLLPADSYCGIYNTQNQEEVIFCMKTTSPGWTFILYGVLFLVSAAALLATVVVTAILPEMRRNIHGRMSLAHNVMLFIAYTAIGISQLRASVMGPTTCAIISFIIQFSILSAFFWLNVMCIDISWTFSGLRPIQGSATQRDRKKFIYYSLYAWGSTALISMATIIVEYSPHTTILKPNFGAQMCFFNNHWAMFVFFYCPMALLLLGNLLLFVYTAFKIFAVRRDTAILSAKDSSINAKNKQKLILYVKLFCLMGITYVTEVISWAVGGTDYWWYFTDTINILRAVFIFVIFCCKRTVYNTIKDKVLRALGCEVSARHTSMATTRSCQSHTSCTTVSSTTTPNPLKKFFSSPSAREASTSSLMSSKDLDMSHTPDPKAPKHLHVHPQS